MPLSVRNGSLRENQVREKQDARRHKGQRSDQRADHRGGIQVVDAHFHNETPESVDKAIALYDDDIVWEAPMRGVVLTDPVEIRKSYMGIFRTVKYNKATALRRFATEEYVFDDQIADVEIVGDEMPNLGFPVGSRLNVRITHIFYMRDGKIWPGDRLRGFPEMGRSHRCGLDYLRAPR